ncbi:Nucleotide-sensitive chloride conductance regulator [Ancylostoma caninum]|uniref:Methylosome subunit pICln n=1 Tax=Ancylostoma caninum TaxID=29170 RepID=A0A368FXZ1_ANCCA|nr:Nucleotide-sensitive chloride conductance regulator [Ancylostoma caninum]
MIILSEVSQPSTGVRLSQPQVVAYMDGHCAGEGTLCISESQVTWICRSSGLGFSLTYPSIILHAISTDLSTFPHECIYVLVDASKSERHRRRAVPFYTAAEARNVQDLRLAEEELNQNGDVSDEDDDEEGKNVVIRFIPSDVSVLQQIYSEMCACQELNPDEGDDFSVTDEEGDGAMAIDADADAMMSGDGWYTVENIGDDGNIELSEEGRANLRRMLNQSNNGNGDQGECEEDEMEEQ